MNGMIFAAGLGTRLAPLTNSRPKALVEVAGEALLGRAVRHFVACGIKNIVVNVHHFAPMVVDYVRSHQAVWGCDIAISDESDLLLDTAGGLAKALPLFASDQPIVVGNADVVCNVPLQEVYMQHLRSGVDATLVTSGRHSTRNLLFDVEGRLAGWVNSQSGEKIVARNVEMPISEAFNGFHVVNQDVVRDFLPAHPMPVIPAYLDRADKFRIVRSLMPLDCHWFDVGTVEKLAKVEAFFS